MILDLIKLVILFKSFKIIYIIYTIPIKLMYFVYLLNRTPLNHQPLSISNNTNEARIIAKTGNDGGGGNGNLL
jgi:hypothetical protein